MTYDKSLPAMAATIRTDNSARSEGAIHRDENLRHLSAGSAGGVRHRACVVSRDGGRSADITGFSDSDGCNDVTSLTVTRFMTDSPGGACRPVLSMMQGDSNHVFQWPA